jgi:hypothetical protein
VEYASHSTGRGLVEYASHSTGQTGFNDEFHIQNLKLGKLKVEIGKAAQ